jgi:carotenoid cleavage dioxygenase-like enzyme
MRDPRRDDMAAAEAELPFHLRGNYAPVTQEVTAFDLPVTGALPPELSGLYLRNGPNPKSGSSPHWFAGDGMVHGVRLEKGRAAWYRNRWVKTRMLAEPDQRFVREDGSVDRTLVVANTNVIGHAGRIYALVENGLPTELSPELETLGIRDFRGKLTTAFTAHPKACPKTGELHFFGYGFFPPYLTYHVLDAAGELVRSIEIPVPGPTMMHDFAITERHVLFMDLPVVFDLELALSGKGFPYRWSDDYGARIGVMPRTGNAAALRWFEIEPCYVFHPWNAYEAADGSIVLDVARYPELWRDTANSFDTASAHRFHFDPRSGNAKEESLDDRAIEFPRIDDRLAGSRHRYGYTVAALAGADAGFRGLIKYDFQSGARVEHDFGAGSATGEGVFVPAGRGEDEGYLLSFVYDEARNGSRLVILDAHDFAKKPLAEITLPQRVPFGFHGNWIGDR